MFIARIMVECAAPATASAIESSSAAAFEKVGGGN
jgi:hypothetical protein